MTEPSRKPLSATWINSLPPEQRQTLLESLSPDDIDLLMHDWAFWARPEQCAPEGDWRIWLFLGGRGAGKTRAGAEWILDCVRKGIMRRVALVGATYADVRDVMIAGESGLVNAGRNDGLRYEPSRRQLHWPDGAVAQAFTAEEPDGLRGHQFDGAWLDEFAKWGAPQVTLDMLLMALRIGDNPRAMITTTPRNIPAVKGLLAMEGVAVTRAGTFANAANLAPAFLEQMRAQYAGTRLGRQELDAELIEDNESALWRRDWIERGRVRDCPALRRIVVAVDPPASVGADADECGIVVAGSSEAGEGYVLADRSLRGLSPLGWAKRAADAYEEFSADAIVAEANQGGAMVGELIRQAASDAPIRLVHARRDKVTRAAPAAALYERGLVHHAGAFAELEDQLCQYDGKDWKGGASPDRLDALVWALADLFPGTAVRPRVRKI
jgi:phage terminase large subunit-like protein